MVGCKLKDLPVSATIATGSVRRKAQLAWMRPDLVFFELRGNIDTRLKKAADYDAIVMAAAAMERIGITPEGLDVLAPHVMVPQAGQGSIAVVCRADDYETSELLKTIEHKPSRIAVDAERAFLAELGGDCNLPAGAHATLHAASLEVTSPNMTSRAASIKPTTFIKPTTSIKLTGLLASLDGRVVLRHTMQGSCPEVLGRAVARELAESTDGRDLIAG